MLSTVATQSRIASFTASFNVWLPDVTASTSEPSKRMRKTFNSWRATSTAPMYTLHSRPSNAAAVADATPCCPAPVSATMRFLPIRLARRVCPRTLLILWEPVWLRSSRFKIKRIPNCSLRLWHSVMMLGRPAYSRNRSLKSDRNMGSAHAS